MANKINAISIFDFLSVFPSFCLLEYNHQAYGIFLQEVLHNHIIIHHKASQDAI